MAEILKCLFGKAHFFFIIVLLGTFFPVAYADTANAKLIQEIDRLIEQSGNNLNIGIKVKDITSGQVLLEKNADRTFLPASNQKIFTAVAALVYLGPDYRYQTQVLADRYEVGQQAIKGNIYLRFAGDPRLETPDLDKLIASLHAAGVGRITGNVYIDDSAFGTQYIGPGWMWDDTKYCFSAPITAQIINQNCVQFLIQPGGQVGHPLSVKPTKSNKYVLLKNQTITKPKGTKGCELNLKYGDNQEYVLDGCLPQERKPLGLSISMKDPHDYAKQVLTYLFHKNGIQIDGEIMVGPTSDSAIVVTEHLSPPLQSLVEEMLKESDNLISDTLFKTMGHLYYKAPGTWKTGAKALQQILQQKVQLDLTNAVMVDGGGLSRYNLVSPDQIIDLLDYAYHQPGISRAFMSALPVGGVDGTLKYRMQDPSLRNRVRAKTGSMSGVTTLAGYLQTSHDKVLAFSIMINGAPGSLSKYRKIEDAICQYLVQNL